MTKAKIYKEKVGIEEEKKITAKTKDVLYGLMCELIKIQNLFKTSTTSIRIVTPKKHKLCKLLNYINKKTESAIRLAEEIEEIENMQIKNNLENIKRYKELTNG